jgi:hypothetical protein
MTSTRLRRWLPLAVLLTVAVTGFNLASYRNENPGAKPAAAAPGRLPSQTGYLSPTPSRSVPAALTAPLALSFGLEVLLARLPAGDVVSGDAPYIIPALLDDLAAFFGPRWRNEQHSELPHAKVIAVYGTPYDTGCSLAPSTSPATPIIVQPTGFDSWTCFDRRSTPAQMTIVLTGESLSGTPARVASRVAEMVTIYLAGELVLLPLPSKEGKWRISACLTGLWADSLLRTGRITDGEWEALVGLWDNDTSGEYRKIVRGEAETLANCAARANG